MKKREGSKTIVFLAVNASYAHSNLAGWYLRAVAERAGWQWHEVEATPNDSLSEVIRRVLRLQPTVLAATFYLFNRSFLLSCLTRYKVLAPSGRVIAGGPEFLGANREFLRRHREIDAVIRGEGELAFAEWLCAVDAPRRWARLPGFCGFIGKRYVDCGLARPVTALDDLPSSYSQRLESFAKPFVLLETSRGCSSRCAFCTSGTGARVRYMSMERIVGDLIEIGACGVPEVRLVDRTFNDRPARCIALLRLFREKFAALRFHLEIEPTRLTPPILAELGRAPQGQLHLEVGLQSLNPAVYRNIRRPGTVDRAWRGLTRLCAMRSVRVHVDLLAGLPGGTLPDLLGELRRVVELQPEEIQLELLKLLPGTALARNCARWHLRAAPEPPYEVLKTDTMSFEELDTARALSQVVDWFYNAPALQDTVVKASSFCPQLWEDLVGLCAQYAKTHAAPSLENRFRILDRYFEGRAPALTRALHYAWLKHGFSPQNGICATRPWKEPIPPQAILVEGDPAAPVSRIYCADLAAPYLFVFGPDRRAAAIYRLPANDPGKMSDAKPV